MGDGCGTRGECGIGQVLHMHRLAQAVAAARQHEAAPALRHAGDPGQGGIAAGPVDQGGTQHGRAGTALFGLREQRRLRTKQAARDAALVVVVGSMLGDGAGGTEGDDARGADRGRGMPAREQVKRTAAEDRVHCRRQAVHAGEIAMQPVPSRRVGTRLPRHRIHAPAGIAQAFQQGQADLSAGTEHQCSLHPGRFPLVQAIRCWLDDIMRKG